MRAILTLYQTAVRKYPVSLQAIQTGALMATGDIVAQTIVEKRQLTNIDLGRIARFGAIGCCLVGPSLFRWYGFLEKHIGATSVGAVFKKVAADQLLFAPSFIIILLSTIGLTQGLPPSQIKDKLFATYPDILINNYKLWPAVQICNFYLTPFEYRVAVVQVIAIFWNTYLSWKTNSQISKNSTEESKEKS